MLASLLFLSFSAMAIEHFPHDVLLDCTVKMQRLGFNKAASDESCSISAGPMCSELQSAVIQRSYPSCVGELIYQGVRPHDYAMQFCNMSARRKKQCVPQQYIMDRERYAKCVRDNLAGHETNSVLQSCLEKILLNR